MKTIETLALDHKRKRKCQRKKDINWQHPDDESMTITIRLIIFGLRFVASRRRRRFHFRLMLNLEFDVLLLTTLRLIAINSKTVYSLIQLTL